MLRALLTERFQLKVHREKKEQNVYSLEVAKGGHKMKDAPPATPPPAEPPKADIVVGAGDQQIRVNRAGGAGQGVVMSGGRNGTTRVTMGPNQTMHMEMEHVSMTDLVRTLTPMLDRPVVDRTGLTGAYQIALDLTMQDMMSAARSAGIGANLPPAAAPQGLAASDPSGGSIFSSIQQLGLRLEKSKSEVETIVVDSSEKEPSAN
jgi:uncharacterized protein (TIGR03435 family)